ncbi:Potassium Voltage-Gated Channel Subfamily Kqt Member 4 [Manis pentadactyla]|nr:Potassium Voltage-Gated Channel Subfamily Kqt Member 4 [Manis pentadactyla]
MAPLRAPFFICAVEPPGVQGLLCPSVAQNQELELAPAESSRVGHKQDFSDGQEVTLGMDGILGCSSGAACGVDQAGHQGIQKKGDKGPSDSEAEGGISMRGPVVKVQKQQMQICGT